MAPPDAKPKEKFVGRSVPRLEDRPLLTGQGRFAADISFPQQLHMRVVRSNFAHGRIRSIDTSAALAKAGRPRGVDGRGRCRHSADRLSPDHGSKGWSPTGSALFATDTVRYVGEPVAAVFADDPYLAEDAAELVVLDIEELPPLLRADAEPGEFEPGRSTEPAIVRKDYGDVDAAFRSAHAVVARDARRSAAIPASRWRPAARSRATTRAREVLELHGAAKVPHWNRDQIARMLGRAPSRVHLYEGHVGGGFGIRGELYPEDVLVCAAALRLRRPVKWIEDRREHLIAANHSRQQLSPRSRRDRSRRAAFSRIDDEFFHDQGAYMRTHAATVPDLAAAMLPGPYRVPAYRADGAYPADQQDAVRHLSRARPLREHVRARAAARCDRRQAGHRSGRGAAPQSDRGGRRCPTRGRSIRSAPRSCSIPATMPGCSTRRWRRSDGRAAAKSSRSAAPPGELVGAGVALFVEKSGLGPFDGVRVTRR